MRAITKLENAFTMKPNFKSKIKTLSSAAFVAGVLLSAATGAQAATKLCGLVHEAGTIAGGDREVIGVLMEYDDASFTSNLFNSCKQMRETLIKENVPYTSQINGANPPQVHRVHMLMSNNAKSDCMPETEMQRDKVYTVFWSLKAHGPNNCGTFTRK